jgi:hypothetical protein
VDRPGNHLEFVAFVEVQLRDISSCRGWGAVVCKRVGAVVGQLLIMVGIL